jgi:DNA-binding response OmpR family regulator
MTNRSLRILVLDDSPEYLAFMRALLTAEGFQVEVAQSGAAARTALATTLPDLIISDVRVPDMPAFGMLDLVDTDEKARGIPVLFCTGATREVEEAAGRLKRPRTEVLLKPFDVDDLLACVSRLAQPAGGR